MNVAIFGLGYVGCVSASCFAKYGHNVIGVDVQPDKVDIINNGESPIVEEGLGELISKAVKTGRLRATSSASDAVNDSQIFMICVGTPSQKNGNVDLSAIYGVAKEIGSLLKSKKGFHVISIRSTVPPGTLDKVLTIASEAAGRKISGCSNPEFLREGTALFDFDNPPYTVIGESDKQSGDLLSQLYDNISAPVIRTDIRVAEMIKYANNTFHAVKVVFANEIGAVCKSLGIDSHKVMDIVIEDKKLNISGYYLKPGFAYGGSCLPKDVRALNYIAKNQDVDIPMIRSVNDSNQLHIDRAIDMILSYDVKNIGILGLSFKGNTDDLRESPVVNVVEALIGKGLHVKIFDRNVHFSKLFGANKKYINEKIPHISQIIVNDISEIMAHSEMIIIGNHSDEFKTIILEQETNAIILDLVRIIKNLENSPENYTGLCW